MLVRMFALLCLVSLGGCTAVSLATIGTAAGIAATAVSTGADVYNLGKLDTAELVPLEGLHQAVHKVADEMGLKHVEEQSRDGSIHFSFGDDREGMVRVTLESRTPTLSRIRINVGVFGNEPTARLFLQRIRANLETPGGQPSLTNDSQSEE